MNLSRLKTCFLMICLVASPHAFAQGTDMYVCTDDSGIRTYQNSGGGKGCKKLNLEPLISVPALKVAPDSPSVTTPAPGSNSAEGKQSPAAVSAARYDSATASRESDRRRILEEELRREEARLGELKAEFNNGQPERRADDKTPQKYLERTNRVRDDIARSESNINALKRELSKLAM